MRTTVSADFMLVKELAAVTDYPLVSVVLIACNGEKYIARQIESILSQTYRSIELIISDDNSRDRTLAVAREFEVDPRVIVTQNSNPAGIHSNLQNGLSYINGDLIAVSDQDDWWEPDKIGRLVKAIGDSDAIFSDSALIDASGKMIQPSLVDMLSPNSGAVGRNYRRLLLHNCVSGHALMFRRQLLGLVLPFARVPVYDQQIALAAAASNGVAFEPAALVKHRIHETNSTNRFFSTSSGSRNEAQKIASRRERIRILKSSVSIALRGLASNKSTAPSGGDRYLDRVHRHLSRPAVVDKLESNEGGRRFDIRLFVLLLPLLFELRYFHRGKRSPIKALINLCRY